VRPGYRPDREYTEPSDHERFSRRGVPCLQWRLSVSRAQRGSERRLFRSRRSHSWSVATIAESERAATSAAMRRHSGWPGNSFRRWHLSPVGTPVLGGCSTAAVEDPHRFGAVRPVVLTLDE
jgi:hypothetical protein